MGDPFRVESMSFVFMVRRCIPLRFMHPRLFRGVPFRDRFCMHQPWLLDAPLDFIDIVI